MKTQLLFLLLFALLSCTQKQESKIYKAMTYNIRYDNPRDEANNWHKRKAELIEQIQTQAPDILGIQEGLSHAVHYLDSTLSNYSYVGVGREDGKTQGEYAPIFYNESEWKCLQNKTFWLSETPETISTGWDAALERICTYALLENKETKKQIWVLNIHFDHEGRTAREKSSQLLISKITELQQEKSCPVLLMGDFNATPEEKPIQLLSEKLEHNYYTSSTNKIEATYNDFNLEIIPQRRIDYIFTKDIKVEKSQVLTEKRENGNYFSDHFPVLISFSY